MFRPIIISGKKYFERLYTIFITFCETFFHAYFVTDMRYDSILSVSLSHVCSYLSVQVSYKSFEIIPITSLIGCIVSRL